VCSRQSPVLGMWPGSSRTGRSVVDGLPDPAEVARAIKLAAASSDRQAVRCAGEDRNDEDGNHAEDQQSCNDALSVSFHSHSDSVEVHQSAQAPLAAYQTVTVGAWHRASPAGRRVVGWFGQVAGCVRRSQRDQAAITMAT
jgi:hypothetical protein